MSLYQVAAQGGFVVRLGRQCFGLGEAVAIASDLRARGYADAHAQVFDPERPHPPYALTLSVRLPR